MTDVLSVAVEALALVVVGAASVFGYAVIARMRARDAESEATVRELKDRVESLENVTVKHAEEIAIAGKDAAEFWSVMNAERAEILAAFDRLDALTRKKRGKA